MTFDDNDVQSTALCATKEARGDGLDACIAVMWVISNRAWDWNESVHQVVYGKNQFTSMSVPNDPEFNWEPESPEDIAIYEACLKAAQSILNRDTDDPTLGSHYYENPKTAQKGGWFDRNIKDDPTNHPQRVIFGKQSFFA